MTRALTTVLKTNLAEACWRASVVLIVLVTILGTALIVGLLISFLTSAF